VLRGQIWVGAQLHASDVDAHDLLARFSQAIPRVEVSFGRVSQPKCSTTLPSSG
jgi:hypothetical protein